MARRVNGQVVVGHNVGVDWRLLHRRYPAITPVALVDTLRLARHLKIGAKNSLSALTDLLELTDQVEALAAGSQPHRALWDTVATALLLPELIARCWPTGPTLGKLLEVAAIDLVSSHPAESASSQAAPTLFDLPVPSCGSLLQPCKLSPRQRQPPAGSRRRAIGGTTCTRSRPRSRTERPPLAVS